MNADAWNRKYPERTEVVVLMDDGRALITKTRSRAFEIGDGMQALVLIDGKTGGYALERVTATNSD